MLELTTDILSSSLTSLRDHSVFELESWTRTLLGVPVLVSVLEVDPTSLTSGLLDRPLIFRHVHLSLLKCGRRSEQSER